MNDFKELYDLDPHFDILDDDGHIMVNGQVYTYEMTLSPEIDDEHCCRVMINGEYTCYDIAASQGCDFFYVEEV